MVDKDYIFKRVKKAVLSFDPEAEIILYGSRARGTSAEDSDWDFLILTQKEFDRDEKIEIHHMLYEIEWELEEVITAIIHTNNHWHRHLNRVTPFYKNVSRDGVTI